MIVIPVSYIATRFSMPVEDVSQNETGFTEQLIKLTPLGPVPESPTDSPSRPGVLTGIPSSSWQTLETNDPFFKTGRHTETPGCSLAGKTSVSRVVTTFQSNVDSLLQGKIDFLFGLHEDVCFAEGNILHLYVPESDLPFTSFKAVLTAKIEKVFVANADILSSDFFKLAGLDKLNYSAWRSLATFPGDRLEVVVRLANVKPIDPKLESNLSVPPVFFRTAVVQAGSIDNIFSTFDEKNVVFLDVNPTPLKIHPKKGRYLHIPFNVAHYTKNVPYRLAQHDISAAQFNLTPLLELAPLAVVLIGSGPNDARSFYALSQLEVLVARLKIYWLFDGMDPSRM